MKKKRIAIICIVIALAVVCAGIIFFPVLQVHEAERSGELDWELSSRQENGRNYVDISFSCFDVRRKVTNVSTIINYDGTVYLSVTTRGLPHFASYEEELYRIHIPDFPENYSDDTSPEIKKVVLESENESLVLWEEEVIVDRLTAEMFAIATNNKAAFDSRIDALLTCFGVNGWAPQQQNADGSYPPGVCSSLTETDAGYKLSVSVNGDVVLYEKTDALKELQKYSCILIALINDLEEVTWEYSFNGKSDTLRFEASDAAALLGSENGGNDIKEYGKTAAGLQRLIDQTGFYSGVFIG